MGSLVINPDLTLQLWDDPLFWESVNWAEDLRENAEELVAKAQLQQSSLIFRTSSVYNQWIAKLAELSREDPASLEPLIAYIRQRRHRNDEDILIQPSGAPTITLANRE